MRWWIPVVCLVAFQTGRAIAHGAVIQYKTTQALEIQANYDTGAPMKQASVTVYAPNKEDPWLKGQTDDKGRFTFAPDASLPGNWEVKVRSAGHGDIVTIPVGATNVVASTNRSSGYTPLQKGVMTASVVWGLIGTALFFWRRK
ncbi:carboxypeptidase regulatory-like domain-containing protein [Leptothermofonsia sp. ETS-13]|uniref:carboxypeptidase regulatory-like domain-containing protein n=1 Tax=Leptothermofonsia sp. ETS-13 TaxID=3035696 RepID=UPI003BA39E99